MKKVIKIFYLTSLLGLISCAGESPSGLKKASTVKKNSTSGDATSSTDLDKNLTNEDITFSGSKKEQIKQYQNLITERSSELNFLRNSEDKLSKLILQTNNRGCMLSKNIDSLEIEIGGGVQDKKNIDDRKRSEKENEGSPDDIVITLGSGMTLTFDGNGLFKNKRVTTDKLSGYKVADISMVSFVKDGEKYENDKYKEKENFVSREVTYYRVYELNRWSLQEVRLKVNGVTIYDKGGIDQMFEGGRDEFKDSNIKSNRAYINMLSKVDCE